MQNAQEGAGGRSIAVRVEAGLYSAADGFGIVSFAPEEADSHDHGVGDGVTPIVRPLFVPEAHYRGFLTFASIGEVSVSRD